MNIRARDTWRFRSLACIAGICLIQAGCDNKPQERTQIAIKGATYTLLPASDAKFADLTGVQLVGCSDAERRSISQCLGRIPTNLPISKIEVAWAEKPMAVRVSVRPDCYVYLIKNEDGGWSITDSVLWNP